MTPFHVDLQCHVRSLTYDFSSEMLYLFLPAHNCTDMSGAIRLAKGISPSVNHIVIFVGGGDRYAYKLTDEGWKSHD